MVTHLVLSESFTKLLVIPHSLAARLNRKGQAVVEFTLIFILLLVVAWIPADFGLAFYTGQIAQNAAREGARIAAADPNLVAGPPAAPTVCAMPACYSAGNIFNETAARLPAALLTGTQIFLSLEPAAAGCNRIVTVKVAGNYNFFFFQILRLTGMNVPNSAPITRSASMRWEHQNGCAGF